MSRGRHPDQGRKLAEPVAKRRGVVHMIEPGQNTLLDLVIAGPGIFYAVTIRRIQRLRASLSDLEAGFGDLIGEVRQLPCGDPVSREIWWYNRAGHLRFFRVNETALVELAADGSPLTEESGKRRKKRQVRPTASEGEVPKDSVQKGQAGSGTQGIPGPV